MGLFGKSEEEKIEKQKRKQEELKLKQEKEMEELMKRFNLSEMEPEDRVHLQSMKYMLMGTGMMSFGNMLTSGKETVMEKYLQVIIEQNWLLLKEMQRIRKDLNKE